MKDCVVNVNLSKFLFNVQLGFKLPELKVITVIH